MSVQSKHRPARAVIENLEPRQLLAGLSLGRLPLGYNREIVTGLKEINYDFRLEKPTKLSADLSAGDNSSTGTLTLYRNNKRLMSGDSLSKSLLATGQYSLRYTGNASNTIAISTSTLAAPTRLEAEALDGNTIRLNWDDNSDNESQYRIDRWTKKGWRKGVRTEADATAVLIKNLSPDTAVTYRINAVNEYGESVRSINTLVTQTLAENTTGFYSVKIIKGMARREAGWTKQADTLKVWPAQEAQNGWSKWIKASSWKDAIYKQIGSVGGPVQVKRTDNTIASHNFPSGGDFKVGLEKDIKASSPGSDALSSSSNTKLIALEDSYGSIDRDYDDFVWEVDVISGDLKFQRPRDVDGALPIRGQFSSTQLEIPEAEEQSPGRGVFIRPHPTTWGEDDSRIDFDVDITPSSDTFREGRHILRRSTVDVQVFTENGSPLFSGSDLTAVIIPLEGKRHFEITTKVTTQSTLTLAYRETDESSEQLIDTVDIKPYTSQIVAFSGETFGFRDPFDNGIFDVAKRLYIGGANVAYYDVNSQTAVAKANAERFIDQGMKRVGILGHSHGGGATYRLSRDLSTGARSYTLAATAYVDAIQHDSTFEGQAEDRLPIATAYHVNYYQDSGILQGVATPGGNVNLNVRTTTWGAALTHVDIDNDPTTIANVSQIFEAYILP
jgi:hypothetical protein